MSVLEDSTATYGIVPPPSDPAACQVLPRGLSVCRAR